MPNNKNRNTKILVTGGAGFIGSNLVEKLVQQKKEVIVLDNCTSGNKLSKSLQQQIHFINEDVRNFDAVFDAAKNCDAIFHLAAIVGVDEVIQKPDETIEVETLGLQYIAKVARYHKVKKIIYASSSAVYNDAISNPSCEKETPVPKSIYATAKWLNENYLTTLSKESDIETISLRFFNIYGNGQDHRMVIPRFFMQALRGDPIVIYGNGKQTRDFTFVNDAVDACSILLEKKTDSEIFNISIGNEVSILELAHLIKKITRSSSEIQRIPFPMVRLSYKVERRRGNPSLLFQKTGYKPSTSLEEGLERYFDFLKKKISLEHGRANH